MSSDRARKALQQIETGEWLQRTRTDAGLSRTALAAALGVTAQQVSNYELGKAAIPEDKPGIADTLAELFSLDVVEVRQALGWWAPSSSEAVSVLAKGQLSEADRQIIRDIIERNQR